MLTENRGAAGTAANGAGRRITVREAQIKTATVEVKALTISGKQVTQSVFWQLTNESIIETEDNSLALRGVPWGRVNYFRPPCKDDHLHVVWQKGDELRRACVWEEGYLRVEDWTEGSHATAEHIGNLRAWQVAVGQPQMSAYKKGEPAVYKVHNLAFWFMPVQLYLDYEGPRLVYSLPDWAGYVMRHFDGDVGRAYREKDAATHRERMERHYGTPEALAASIEEEAGYMVRARDVWQQRWSALCALDQLFIAV